MHYRQYDRIKFLLLYADIIAPTGGHDPLIQDDKIQDDEWKQDQLYR